MRCRGFLSAQLFVLCVSTAFAQSPPPLPPQRDKIDLFTVTNGCGPNNPKYLLTEASHVQMTVRLCIGYTFNGQPHANFSDFSVLPNQPSIEVGCGLLMGKLPQSFSIHWEEVANGFPLDITNPINDIRVYQGGCASGGCRWFISNRNYFKPIQVTYIFRHQTISVLIMPLTDMPLAKSATDPPEIAAAAFSSPYQAGYCLSGSDKYPPIPAHGK